MDTIYVTGHRNPDTDSIVAAMAYTALRNALGDREYEAACLGHVSDETQIVLDRFGFQAPTRIHNMFTQVRDLDFDKPPVFSAAMRNGFSDGIAMAGSGLNQAQSSTSAATISRSSRYG